MHNSAEAAHLLRDRAREQALVHAAWPDAVRGLLRVEHDGLHPGGGEDSGKGKHVL